MHRLGYVLLKRSFSSRIITQRLRCESTYVVSRTDQRGEMWRMEVETVMRELSTVESSIVQSPDVPVVGAKIRCYAVQQDATVRGAFKEHCQMLLALNLVQSWHDCLWE